MNKRQQIIESKRIHEKNMQESKIFSYAYYYAESMVNRAEQALKIEDDDAAFRYFVG